jgi:hypothetical protein
MLAIKKPPQKKREQTCIPENGFLKETRFLWRLSVAAAPSKPKGLAL